MCVNDFIYRRRAIAAVGLILLAFTSRGVCVCVVEEYGGQLGGFDQSYVNLMTKWDPTRTELAGLTQLVVTLGGQSNDGGGG